MPWMCVCTQLYIIPVSALACVHGLHACLCVNVSIRSKPPPSLHAYVRPGSLRASPYILELFSKLFCRYRPGGMDNTSGGSCEESPVELRSSPGARIADRSAVRREGLGWGRALSESAREDAPASDRLLSRRTPTGEEAPSVSLKTASSWPCCEPSGVPWPTAATTILALRNLPALRDLCVATPSRLVNALSACTTCRRASLGSLWKRGLKKPAAVR